MVVGQVTGHGQLQHAAVSQLVHWALVVVGHVLAAAQSAVTFVVVNNKRATTTANAKMVAFFILFPSTHIRADRLPLV